MQTSTRNFIVSCKLNVFCVCFKGWIQNVPVRKIEYLWTLFWSRDKPKALSENFQNISEIVTVIGKGNLYEK